MSAAAACVRHPAGHAIIISLSIYHLVPAAAACVRRPAHDAGHNEFISLSFLYYLSLSAFSSSSIREASCGNIMPAIVISLSLLMFNINFLFCYLSFSVCSGSMRQASCWSCHYYLFILYLFILYLSFSACSGSMREASCA
jgi:hypothetical protein